MKVKLQSAAVFAKLNQPKRFKVVFGGRGSGKSWEFARNLTLRSLEKTTRILCTREIQSSIDESVKKLLDDTINRMGVSDYFDVQDKKINSPHDGKFFFMGMERGGKSKIKSTEGIDIVWCEEAENISALSWEFLIPTIRKEFSEIWISFNPADEMDATHQMFVAPYLDQINRDGFYEDDEIIVIKANYWDNPWFPDVLETEMLKMKRQNYNKYLHIWEGECNSDYEDSLIQPEWFDAAIDAHKKLGFKARGLKVMGFDPADEGQDAKAISIVHGVVLTHLEQWLDSDLSDSTDKSYDIAIENGCTNFIYDGDGIGAGVKAMFKRSDAAEQITLTNYKGSNSPDFPTKPYSKDYTSSDGEEITNENLFRNKRAQYWWSLRDRFEKTFRAVTKGEYIDPSELISLSSELKEIKQLKSELTRQQRKRGITNTMIQMESKREMIKQKKKSPNLADALVMAFAAPAPKSKSNGKIRRVDLGTTA